MRTVVIIAVVAGILLALSFTLDVESDEVRTDSTTQPDRAAPALHRGAGEVDSEPGGTRSLVDHPTTTKSIVVTCVQIDTRVAVPNVSVEFGVGVTKFGLGEDVLHSAITDTNGIATIVVQHGQTLEWVRAKHDAYFPVACPRRIHRLPERMTIEFFGTWKVAGVVFAPDGSFIHGARVQMTWPSLSGARMRSTHLGKTEKEGRFEVTLRSRVPEGAVLVVSHWRYPSKHVKLLEGNHHLSRQEVRVFMEEGVQIAGRVVDDTGQPVEKGDVQLYSTSTPLLPGWKPHDMMGNMARQFELVSLWADLGKDGTFLLKGWPPGRPGRFTMRVPGRSIRIVTCPGGKIVPNGRSVMFERGQDLGQVVVRFIRLWQIRASGTIEGLGESKPADLEVDMGGGVSCRMKTTWKPGGRFRARVAIAEARLKGKEVWLRYRSSPTASTACRWGPYLITGDLRLRDLSGLLR